MSKRDWWLEQEERRKESEHQEFLKRKEQVEADRASGALERQLERQRERNRKERNGAALGILLAAGLLVAAVLGFLGYSSSGDCYDQTPGEMGGVVCD